MSENLRWLLYLTMDEMNALLLALEDEAICSQNGDFGSAYEKLMERREDAIKSEAARFVL